MLKRIGKWVKRTNTYEYITKIIGIRDIIKILISIYVLCFAINVVWHDLAVRELVFSGDEGITMLKLIWHDDTWVFVLISLLAFWYLKDKWEIYKLYKVTNQKGIIAEPKNKITEENKVW